MCDDSWDTADAQVVCRQLGYPTNNSVPLKFGKQGTRPVLLDDVKCTGDEPFFLRCKYSSGDNCSNYEESGVRCAAELNYGNIHSDNIKGYLSVYAKCFSLTINILSN